MSISTVFQMLTASLIAAMNWLRDILTSIDGAAGVVLAAFFLYHLVRFLVSPLRGHGSSDLAKKKKDGDR